MSASPPVHGHHGRFAAGGLPEGYSSQPAWGFSFGSAGASCEFNRVYGLTEPRNGRGPAVRRLDSELSYWSVARPQRNEWWLRYAHARELLGARLSFERFSSLAYMREHLPQIFEASVVAPGPPEKSNPASSRPAHGGGEAE